MNSVNPLKIIAEIVQIRAEIAKLGDEKKDQLTSTIRKLEHVLRFVTTPEEAISLIPSDIRPEILNVNADMFVVRSLLAPTAGIVMQREGKSGRWHLDLCRQGVVMWRSTVLCYCCFHLHGNKNKDAQEAFRKSFRKRIGQLCQQYGITHLFFRRAYNSTDEIDSIERMEADLYNSHVATQYGEEIAARLASTFRIWG